MGGLESLHSSDHAVVLHVGWIGRVERCPLTERTRIDPTAIR